MGYIKEPEGVDFFVDSKPLSEKDRKDISDIIAHYKLTGQKRKVISAPIHRITLTRKQKAHQLIK
jgi:hypothetical protein